MRILVDKVMQKDADWVAEEWMVEETAEAGFSLYSPRQGYDDYDEVEALATWCQKHGLMYMPWMGGTLRAPEGGATGRKLVWSSGLEQDLWSPNSSEFWDWMSGHIRKHARISPKYPNLIGVFLDFENYASGKPRHHGNCYPISYDDVILEKFSNHKGIEIPKLGNDERRKWLERKKIHSEFVDFQIRHWRHNCKELRKAVDQSNHQFRFCIYPAPGTTFMTEACYPEWSTKEAPIILADATTYGRPSRMMVQEDAIRVNQEKLGKRMEIPERANIPFSYIGGIDPVVIGADPEFCGKNAVGISEVSDGYWVFYEGPEYGKDHADYFRWFKQANQAIKEGNFEFWKGPRETESIWGLALTDDHSRRRRIVSPGRPPRMENFPVAKMTSRNVVLIGASSGHEVKVGIGRDSRGEVGSAVKWTLEDPNLDILDKGRLAEGPSEISFKPKVTGVYPLTLEGDDILYWITESNSAVGLYAARRLNLMGEIGRLYFRVPELTDRFTVRIRGSGEETARLTLYEPSGLKAGEAQTNLRRRRAEMEIWPEEEGQGNWSLEITPADEGVLRRSALTIRPGASPVVSLRPEHSFDLRSP